MGKISLRRYNHEIESLIDQGNQEEAIAHCKYILQKFPKYVDTYRLLGNAYLESQRYSEAADIFQRVLSVIPDDFVSQIGLSIIREDEGNLDAALWHIERAFEVQPSNAAIQEEIRRLYGKRDGVQISKVRLTRGALIRMYLQGELYDQAISETRSALSEDPHRMDLEVLLARMYYLSGQKVEAAEVCSQIIQKLPYCLEANKILAVILASSGRSEDAKIFQQRIHAIEPYAAHVSKTTPSITQVADDAITIEKLSIDASQKKSDQPEWAQITGTKLEESEQDELPEWLPTVTPTQPLPFNEQESYPQFDGEIEPIEEIEMPVAEDHIPDWMKAAGWVRKDSDSAGEAEEMLEAEEVEDEEAAKSQLPEWLRDLHPESSAVPGVDKEIKPEETTDETQKMPVSFGMAEDKEDQRGEPFNLQEEEEDEFMETPDWLQDIETSEKPAELGPDLTPEISEWLQIQNEQEVISAEMTEIMPAEEPTASDEIDSGEWLKMLADEHDTETGDASDEQIEIPDWITGKHDAEVLQEEEIEVEPTEVQEQEQESLKEGEDEAETQYPNWFEELEEEHPVDAVSAAEDQVPDWALGEGDEEEMEITSAELEELEIESDIEELETEQEAESEDIDAAIAWLESLSVSDTEEKESKFISPEESPGVASQWMMEETQEHEEETSEPAMGVEDMEEEDVESEQPADELDEFSFTLSDEEIAPWQGVVEEETEQDENEISGSIPDFFNISPPEGESQPGHEPISDEVELIRDLDKAEDLVQGEEISAEEGYAEFKEESPFVEDEHEIVQKPEEIVEEIFHVLEREPEDQVEVEPVELEAEPMEKDLPSSSSLALEFANQALSGGEIEGALEQYAKLIQQGVELDEIIENLKRATDIMPQEFEIWQTLGDAYAQKNLLNEALKAYSKAEELLS
jgi:tetratricopeptide (TPR) repeat protein